MFLLILPAADLVARAQGAPGLASYGMGCTRTGVGIGGPGSL